MSVPMHAERRYAPGEIRRRAQAMQSDGKSGVSGRDNVIDRRENAVAAVPAKHSSPDRNSQKSKAASPNKKDNRFSRSIQLCLTIAGVMVSLGGAVLSEGWVQFLLFVLLASILLVSYLVSRHEIRWERFSGKSNDAGHDAEVEALQDRVWELRESEERYRSLAEAFGDLMMLRDGQGRVSHINESFARTFQLSAEQMIGQFFEPRFLEEIHRTDTDNHNVANMLQLREVKLQVRDTERWFAWLDLPVRNDQTGETSLRTMARDITRQKQIERDLRDASERAEAASQAKSRFLANVSHEMRTPLNGILGMSGLLGDTSLTAEQNSYVEAVRDSGSALLTLIEDILDMSVVEAGKIELKPSEINPGRLSENVCELLASRAHAKSISISSRIAPGVPEYVEADGNRLRQVLINLVGNAVKFTQSGGVHLEVSCPAEQVEGTNLVALQFTVRDSGPGIDPADQKLIFEEFAQADQKSTREHGGAGLGLAISRSIVAAMGGEISLSSIPEKGSEFSFVIDVPLVSRRDENRESNLLEGRQVFLLGGSPFEQHMLSGYVADQSGIATSMESISELQKQQIASGNILLIDQDVVLAGNKTKAGDAGETFRDEDGLQQVLRFPETRKIILVEPEEREHLKEYLENGFDGYLIKPVRRASFINVVTGRERGGPEEKLVATGSVTDNPSAMLTESKRILLAEDNDINALLARTILEKAGHVVTRAHNGAEAVSLWLERLDNEAFEVILMDLQMPVMDGLDALREIRAREKNIGEEKVPVYILTADEQQDTRIATGRAGADGFLTKPLEPSRLLDVVVQGKVDM